MKPERDSRESLLMAFGTYGAVGFQLVIAVVIGFWLGNYGDEHFGTKPWLTILGIVLGAAAGFYNLILLLKRLEKK